MAILKNSSQKKDTDDQENLYDFYGSTTVCKLWFDNKHNLIGNFRVKINFFMAAIFCHQKYSTVIHTGRFSAKCIYLFLFSVANVFFKRQASGNTCSQVGCWFTCKRFCWNIQSSAALLYQNLNENQRVNAIRNKMTYTCKYHQN